MKINRRAVMSGLALGMAFAGFAKPVLANEITLNVLYNLPGFTKFHQPLADEFMKKNPDVKINFLAPAEGYNQGQQQVLRSAVTGNLPDVYFSGYNLTAELVHALAPRNQITDLGPFIQAEGGQAFLDKNYSPKMAALGQIDGKQYGLPVNASSPIIYINSELVTKAGGDPDKMPTTFPELIALAKKIKALDPKLAGMSYDINGWGDDWLWQALVFEQGGKLVDDKTKTVAFDNEIGLNALKMARQFVTEGGQNLLDWDQSRQQFGAGLTGFIFSTPAHVQTIQGLVGDRFKLKTATFPLDNKEKGGVPTGGNSAVILTQEKAKQDAAWKYLKWITGPEAQNTIVRITGYLPTNKLATGPDFLAPYYAENPNVKTASLQADRSLPWGAYPGGESVRIWRTQRDIIGTVMRGEVTPEAGLKQIVEQTNALMK
ncbi:ABC transporter substrate-binding protein [Rhizobium oryzihabitans]|jgi:multiple sugar transport system substrate-binding protein|uniref:ABC transporter substrate-binding protein n=1 Tax=Rhizobium oryzihabitans TaxID=2267833 RepID=A0A7L5BH67_9HYPH|nr:MULTISPECIES: ABC transporter substrate-binding protein [Rhizobium]MCW0982953.1 ABC transporter substrate-binding protein [Agrobacterium sp. BT-220-3]QCM03910.1 ABC transporter substrate-binding protein [Agrobacterium tumefaciens]CUX41249.1 ABC transporter, substrate binding protein (Sugar) [Agrobacterium genomosp. 5 str. CFBP 6626]HCD83959.1 ABC transporter substrate-binding protein [Agrobacterium sp.]QCM08981.1 ABC transporter substrate-binding protein [Agrobacterium tumefaciens]